MDGTARGEGTMSQCSLHVRYNLVPAKVRCSLRRFDLAIGTFVADQFLFSSEQFIGFHALRARLSEAEREAQSRVVASAIVCNELSE